MNNEDMSDMIQKLATMLNNSDNEANNNNSNHTQDDVSSNSNTLNEDTIKNILSSLNSKDQSSDDSNNSDNSNFNFDIQTVLKMKNMMDKINSNKNDPRSNLLISLKPYLNNNRKEKLDQYIQFLNISKILEAFNSEGGVNSK